MNGKQMIKMEVPLKKRGRPQGKGRAPLSLEERRARNAFYERERRAENAEAMAQLAAAVGFNPDETTNADLLATVITLIRNANVPDPAEDVDALKRVNSILMEQIQAIEQRIKSEPRLDGLVLFGSDDDDVAVRTHSNRVGRKKLKLERPTPEVPCSRTSIVTYGRYTREKRVRTQAARPQSQPLPTARALEDRTTPLTDTSMGNDTGSEAASTPPPAPSAPDLEFTPSGSLPVLDCDFVLKYLPSS